MAQPSIARHIAEVYAMMLPGQSFTVARISETITDEYPDENRRPQLGRIKSRLQNSVGEPWGRCVFTKRTLKDGEHLVLAKPRQYIKGKVCAKCDTVIPWHHFNLTNGVGDRCKKFSLCQVCDFWYQVLAWSYNGDETFEGQRVLFIDGHCYIVHAEDLGGPRGSGGQSRAYVLLDYPKFNGEELVFDTTNMWSAGEIPEAWREQFPDNARFHVEGARKILHPAKV